MCVTTDPRKCFENLGSKKKLESLIFYDTYLEMAYQNQIRRM